MGRRLGAQLAAVAALAALTFVVVGTVWGGGESGPRLLFVQDVPTDVRSATVETFERFRDRFAGRASCIDDVSIKLVRAVDEGDARYVTVDRRIEIQIPTTPDRFQESLAHELAHHLERTCDEFGPLRIALEPLLEGNRGDGGEGVAWSRGPTWEETPSEQFAEAVVELVNGARVRHVDTVPVDPATLELIARWGRKAPLTPDR